MEMSKKMKIEEMMQPLEEDELEEVSGGMGGNTEPIFKCSSCSRCFKFGGNCPDCGGTLVNCGFTYFAIM